MEGGQAGLCQFDEQIFFTRKVPLAYIERIFEVMENTPRHRYQILTKRSERMAELAPKLYWPPNVWMGVSIEDSRVIDRADALGKVPAAIRFLSLEPLIGPIPNLNLDGNRLGESSAVRVVTTRGSWNQSGRLIY